MSRKMCNFAAQSAAKAARVKSRNMCKYNIAIDDALMEEVRPTITGGVDETVWVQLQVEALFKRLAARAVAKRQHVKLSQRLRGIGTAPEGFDYKKELEARFD